MFNTDLMKYIAFFSSEKYRLIDVPFIVDVDVSALTKPSFVKDIYHSEDKVYVGSGEQSFLQLLKEDKIQCGKYMCITPCMRDENVLDDIHYKMFMKLELIHILKSTDNPYKKLEEMFSMNVYINSNHLPDLTWDEITKDKTDVDIYSNGIEIGSYGIRQAYGVNYIYGTGMALPRFTNIKNKDFKGYDYD